MKERLKEFVEYKQPNERLVFKGRINQGDVVGEITLERYIRNEYNIENESFKFDIRRPAIITSPTQDKYSQEDLEYLIEVIEEFDKVQLVEVIDGVYSYGETSYSKIKDVKELLEETLKENY